MDIIWTESSIRTYLSIIDYLFEKWTHKEIDRFQHETKLLLRNLSQRNFSCPLSKLSPYRKCLIDYHTSLVYAAEGNKIVLITFLHNKSAHNY